MCFGWCYLSLLVCVRFVFFFSRVSFVVCVAVCFHVGHMLSSAEELHTFTQKMILSKLEVQSGEDTRAPKA